MSLVDVDKALRDGTFCLHKRRSEAVHQLVRKPEAASAVLHLACREPNVVQLQSEVFVAKLRDSVESVGNVVVRVAVSDSKPSQLDILILAMTDHGGNQARLNATFAA